MIRFLIHRPISVIVVYLAIGLLAILSLTRIPISLLPNIDIPQITILVEQSDYSAQEIENKILQPIRQRILQVDGIESMEGMASYESGFIKVKFIYGIDIDYAFLELNEKVDQSLNNLPVGARRPRVVKSSASELPAFYISLTYKNISDTLEESQIQLSEFADKIVRRRLEQLQSVALVDLSGLSMQQITIQPNENLLRTLGITQTEIQQALETANLTMGTIKVKERQYQYLVRVGQLLSSLDDIKETALLVGERVFKLQDIANISFSERPPEGLHMFNQQRGVSLAVIKNDASRMEKLEEEVNANLDAITNEFPNIRIEKSRDQLFLLNQSIENLQQALLIGGFLATLVVFLFYRSWKVSFIIAVIVPISLLLSILFFDICGLSINIISLSGLILGLGLMIDNGIIVLDNISQLVLEGKSMEQACIIGTNEMITPLLSSMLTTCSVFLPLIFLSGLSGALFFAQALAITIGLATAYIVSITFLPVLYHLLNNGISVQHNTNGKKTILLKVYDHVFGFCFRFPLIFFGFAAIIILTGYWASQKLPLRQLPIIPRTTFETYLNWNANVRPELAKDRIIKMFAPFSDSLVNYSSHIGQQQYLLNHDPLQKANVVHLFVSTKNERTQKKIIQYIESYVGEKFPKANLQFMPERTIFEKLFPTETSDIKARMLLPPNVSERDLLLMHRQVSNSLKSHFPNVKQSALATEEQILMVPREDRLLFYQITTEQLFQELKRAIGTRELMVINTFHTTIPLVISGPRSELNHLLETFQIKVGENYWVSVSQLVHLQKIQTRHSIYSSENGEYLPLNISNVQPDSLVEFLKQYQQDRPQAKFELLGSHFTDKKMMRDLLAILGVSILLLYFIMTAQFESFLQPLIILLEIPISLSGSLLLLYWNGASLNIMAFIGMVVTAGIVINDSIIKVDTINRLRRDRNKTTKEAIHKAGLKRLNPIIMTSVTSILAVLPFLSSNSLGAILQKPLALTLIGGLTIGTAASLFFIPMMYSFFYKNKIA